MLDVQRNGTTIFTSLKIEYKNFMYQFSWYFEYKISRYNCCKHHIVRYIGSIFSYSLRYWLKLKTWKWIIQIEPNKRYKFSVV